MLVSNFNNVVKFNYKKWLLVMCLCLAIAMSSQAADKIAIVNMGILFQQIADKTGISAKMENEFKSRINELQHIENELQNKMKRLKLNSSTMKTVERRKLEKDVMSQHQIFSKKARDFEQDRQRRSNEEQSNLIIYIKNAIKKIADKENIDLVIDASIVVFNNNEVKDITADVIKQVE